jgi:hypothetical protein
MFFGATADVRSWRKAAVRLMISLECPLLGGGSQAWPVQTADAQLGQRQRRNALVPAYRDGIVI